MGCDGGTIPKRDELVKIKKKPEQKDKTSELAFRWQHCAVSQLPLHSPIVACELGRIYNKESILEALLDKNGQYGSSDVVAHIRSLRDVKELQLTENPAWLDVVNEKGDGYIDCQNSKWICPISGQEMNGRFRFSFIWSCGCVLSERALKEMIKSKKQNLDVEESAPHECLRCQKTFDIVDMIVLNPTAENDTELMLQRMRTRRAAAASAKKTKKSSKVAASAAAGAPEEKSQKLVSASVESTNGASKRKVIDEKDKPSSSRAGTSVEATAASSSLKKLKVVRAADKIKGTYSVAKDSNVSETYKSLFTTHENAQTQQKAHWVTYNPFYN